MKFLNMLKGIFKHTGLQEGPKDICKANYNGTWKATDVEDLTPMKQYMGDNPSCLDKKPYFTVVRVGAQYR